MNARDERQLMRLLHGELPPGERRRLLRRLDCEPELAAAHRRLEAVWHDLELPPPAAAPPGFTARVAARARALGPPAVPLTAAPLWVRATAALALAVGLAAGAGLGLWQSEETTASLPTATSSLAESYWQALGSEEAMGGDDGEVWQ